MQPNTGLHTHQGQKSPGNTTGFYFLQTTEATGLQQHTNSFYFDKARATILH